MECMICSDNVNVRNVNLFIIGSEGLEICHACEMDLVTHIRAMRNMVNRGKLRMVQHDKNRERKKDHEHDN